jgi:hypothetical protein
MVTADRSLVRMGLRRYVCIRDGIAICGLLCVVLANGCQMPTNPTNSVPRQDINEVLAAHDDRLMAIPGVVGVYVGLLDDQKTPCLKVMLARKDRKLARSIPRRIDGYPVVTEVTGTIKLMRP